MPVEGAKEMTKKKRDYNGYFSKPVAGSYEEAEKLKEVTNEEKEPKLEKEPDTVEPEPVEEVTVIARVLPEKLNVRIEPQQVDGNVLGIIKKGDRVTVHTAYKNSTWAYISAELEKGIAVDGFVMKGFIEEIKED